MAIFIQCLNDSNQTAMVRCNIILILLFAAMPNLKGQNPETPRKYDTLPLIQDFNQELNLIDKIRCTAYLFARKFTVKESLGNIYVSLFYENEHRLAVKGLIEGRSIVLFSLAYLYALQPNLDYTSAVYKNLVVEAYDEKGPIFFTKSFPVISYQHIDSASYLEKILTWLRLPNTWTIKKGAYQMIYYCIDSEEKLVFHKPLLLILSKLKLLNSACTDWIELYHSCEDFENLNFQTFKLRK